MSVLLHREFLGTNQHILLKNSMIRWTDEDTGEFVYGGKNNDRSIHPFLKLLSIDVPDLIPKEFIRAMSICGSESPQWQSILPKRLYNDNLKRLITCLSEAEKQISECRYTPIYKQTNSLFKMLRPSFLDVGACDDILRREDNHIVKNILNVSSGGLCPVPLYDRVSTKTGRLTIKQGPQVLTLKKEFRSIFKPRSKTSRLYEVDFSSLEPRVASNIARRSPGDDVYSSFMEYAGITSITRDAAKLAVLCSLYGAGKYNLQNQLRKQSSAVSADFLIESVKEYFKIDPLLKTLKKQAGELGMIENYFGRPILVDDERAPVLINNYLQSTAVDVSLLGFTDFCSKLSDKILPLFVIHDALFFEAENNYLKEIKCYLDSGFCYSGLGKFPLTITEFKA